MNVKRWVVASIVSAVVFIGIGMIGNGIFLADTYTATASLWRPEMEMTKLFPYGWLATLIISFIFVYIYHRGYEGKGCGFAEGLRFGFWIGLFAVIPMAVWSYVSYPIPMNLAIAWFIMGMVEFLLAGILVGLIYKRT